MLTRLCKLDQSPIGRHKSEHYVRAAQSCLMEVERGEGGTGRFCLVGVHAFHW